MEGVRKRPVGPPMVKVGVKGERRGEAGHGVWLGFEAWAIILGIFVMHNSVKNPFVLDDNTKVLSHYTCVFGTFW